MACCDNCLQWCLKKHPLRCFHFLLGSVRMQLEECFLGSLDVILPVEIRLPCHWELYSLRLPTPQAFCLLNGTMVFRATLSLIYSETFFQLRNFWLKCFLMPRKCDSMTVLSGDLQGQIVWMCAQCHASCVRISCNIPHSKFFVNTGNCCMPHRNHSCTASVFQMSSLLAEVRILEVVQNYYFRRQTLLLLSTTCTI